MPFSAHLTMSTAVCALTTGLMAAALAPAASASSPAVTPAAAAALNVAAAATLVVGGTTFASMEQELMAQFTNTFSEVLVNVAYPAQLWPATEGLPLGQSMAVGAQNLIDMIATTAALGATTAVWGISQGALVLAAAQRILAADVSAAPPPGALTFIRVANPAQTGTGLLNYLPDLILTDVLQLDASARTAAESQYNTVEIVSEFDAFADFPDRPNLVAVANALLGLLYRHGQTAMVDLYDAQLVTVTVNGFGATTTTVLVPSDFLPLTQPLREAGVPTPWVDALDSGLWPVIKSAYRRYDPLPATVSVPVVGGATAAATKIGSVTPVPVSESSATPVHAAADAVISQVRAAGSEAPAGGLRAPTPRNGSGQADGQRKSRLVNDGGTRPEHSPEHRRR